MYLFTPQLFIKLPQCAKHSSRSWFYNNKQQVKLLVLMGLMLLWLEKDAINKCTCHLGQAVVSATEKGEDKEGGGEGCSFN